MSILNRDVLNEYNLNYDPVGLRNISLPDSFLTKAYAPELDINDIQSRIDAAKNRETLNKAGLMTLDDAGLITEPYETFAEKAKPGLNIDFAKQLGSSALGLITGNPFIGLLARGIGALGDRLNLTGVRGGVDLRGDTTFDTFRRSTSFANFLQRQRDKRAREEAAMRGSVKDLQSRIDRGDFDGRGSDDAPGGPASNQDAARGGQYG